MGEATMTVMGEMELPVLRDTERGMRQLSPTDISQFIRLDGMKRLEELLPAIGFA